ncbi:hypothetical protein [Paucilactobacillus sp. N302-9]
MDKFDELLKEYVLKFHSGVPVYNYKPEELEMLIKQAIESGKPLNPPEPEDKSVFF